MNLLKELKEVLKENNKTIRDIKWIGTRRVYVNIDEFLELADTEYTSNSEWQEIAINLLIVGDNWWLERRAHDEVEWFEYKEMLQKPGELLRLKKGSDNNVGGRWIPKEGEKYFSIDDCGDINTNLYDNKYSKWCLARNNVYKTEKITVRMKEYYLALEKARWYPTEQEWKNDDIEKMMGYYNYQEKKIELTYLRYRNYGIPVFKTGEDAEAFYDKWQAEALIDWGIRSEL